MTMRGIRSGTLRHALALVALISVVDCAGSPTEPRAPRETVISLRQVVSDALVPGQSLEYALTVPRDSTLFLSFQARSGASADTLVATLRAPGGAVLALLRSAGTQPALHDLMAPVAPAAADRDLVVTVSGASPAHGGAFTLTARPMSPAPEKSDAVLAFGGTATEAIDASGDADEFRLQGSGGYVAWLQVAADAPFAEGLRVELLDGTTLLTSVSTTTTQAALGELETEPVTLPRSGEFTVRVRAGNGAQSTGTGAYRVRPLATPPADPPVPQPLLARDAVIDTLSGADSVAAWRVMWRAGTPLAITLEVRDAAPGDSLTATFRTDPGSDSLGAIAAVMGGDVAQFVLPVTQSAFSPSIVATVHGRRRGMTASYRLRFGSQRSDAPETASATLTPGETIAESIGDVNDLDRYLLDAQADSDWVVMLVPRDSLLPELGIRVHDRDENPVAAWDVTGRYNDLERTATYLRLGDRGPYKITVGAAFFRPPEFTGDYLLRVLRQDRGTESAPPQVLVDGTVSGSIEAPGDIDEFRLDVVEGQEVYFKHRPGTPVSQSFVLLDGTTSLQKAPLPDYVLPLEEQHSFRWRAERTGTFTVRVANDQLAGPKENWPAPYEIEVQGVRRAPETAPATGWTFGDTISGEAIERRGDIDEFEVTFDAPQMTRLVFIANRADTLDGVYLTVTDAAGNWMSGPSIGAGSGPDTLRAVPHLEFATPGTYRFTVEGTGLSAVPYRFFMVPSHLGPEVISDTLPVGVWVSGEAIDSIGDADRFVYAVDSGVRYVSEIELLPGAVGAVQFLSSVTWAMSTGEAAVGTATASGYVQAMVLEYLGPAGPALGPYRLRIRPVSVLPETASPTITIGDTITTESIDFFGDEDRYTFTGAAGTALRIVARSAAFDSGARLHARVFLEGDDLPIMAFEPGESERDVVLPANGTYRVVITALVSSQPRDLGPYLLSLVRR